MQRDQRPPSISAPLVEAKELPVVPPSSGEDEAVWRRLWFPLLNWALFLLLGGLALERVNKHLHAGSLDFIEISFAIQNAVLILLVVGRSPHRAVDGHPIHQAIALIAVFSGLAIVDVPAAQHPTQLLLAKGLVLAANILGIITLCNLGRSFGFLIALREIKTAGLYGLVRHPMYGTDILLRIGYSLGNPSTRNLLVLILSSACYVYRAALEEAFLSQDPKYREFMQTVRWRFIPHIY